MSQATELIAKQMAAGANVAKIWGDVLFNVKDTAYAGGAKGNGTTDDTAAVQATIDYAISVGGKAVFFPHGTYKVTALTGLSSVVLFGDNASFVGISNTINQLGNAVSLLSKLADVDITTNPPASGTALGYNPITSKWNPVPTNNINVKDPLYGAKGDGATDDKAAIQSAINAANTAGGGIVYFPPGTYKILTQLSLYSNITLRGSGKDITILLAAAEINGMVNADTVGGNSNITLDSFTLKRLAKVNNSFAIATNFNNVTTLNIVNVKVDSWAGHGIYPTNCKFVNIQNCSADNCGSSGNSGSTYKAIGALQSQHVSISNCISNNCKGGNIQDVIGVAESNFVTITGNILYNSDYGINVQLCNDVTCDGNVIDTCDVIGIDFSNGCKASIISNNTVYNCGNNGIVAWGNGTSNSEFSVIEGNVCRDNGRLSVGCAGIQVGSVTAPGSDKVIVRNNISYDSRTGVSRTQDYGILEPTGNGWSVFMDNVCFNNKTANESLISNIGKSIQDYGSVTVATVASPTKALTVNFKAPFSGIPIITSITLQADAGMAVQDLIVQARGVTSTSAEFVITTRDAANINAKVTTNFLLNWTARGVLA